MKKLKILKASFLLVFTLVCFYDCSAQFALKDTIPLRKRHYSYDKIFSTNHTNFVLRINLLPGRDIRLGKTGVDLHIKTQGGLEIGWMYQFNFIKRWGLQTGIRFEAENQWINVFLPKNYTGFEYDYNNQYLTLGLVSAIVPIYACYYVPFHDRNSTWLANFKLGVDLKYGSGFDDGGTYTWTYVGSTGQQNVNMADLTIHKTIKSNFFASFHASAGINYILPNKKMLNLQIVGNWSPLFRNKIDYSILPGGTKEINGSFIKDYSYIGFELNYILTNPRHMGRKRSAHSDQLK
jgi:hypothetical protein